MNRKELLDHIRQIDRTDLENKFIKLYDALDHIKTIISMARTETRRLRWILARVNYALDFKDWDYPDLEIPRGKKQIKLHPMSEEPKQGTEYFFEISESHILWRESMFMVKAYYGGWE